MTFPGLLIAVATAAVLSGSIGWFARASRSAPALAAAIALLFALPAVTASGPADWLSVFRPAVKLDWLPAATLVAAGWAVVAERHRLTARWLWASATVISLVMIGLILRGTAYTRPDAWDRFGWAGLLALTVWGVALAATLNRSATTEDKHPVALIVAWGVAMACVVATIGATGSVVYAATAGVVATAMLAVSITTGRFPVAAAATTNLLLGLAGLFSQTPWAIATGMQVGLAILAVLTSRAKADESKESDEPNRRHQWLLPTATPAVMALLAAWAIAPQVITTDEAATGYAPPPASSAQANPPQVSSLDEKPKPPGTAASSQERRPDPFGGLGLP